MKNYTKKITIIFSIVLLFLCGFYIESKTVNAKQKSYTVTPNTKLKVTETYYKTVKKGKKKKRKKMTRKKKEYKNYNKYTRQSFVLQDRLKKLEKSKGGTLTLKKGTYKITQTLAVPSNVKIVLKNGVVIKKSTKTGTKKLKAQGSIFQLIKPSKHGKKGVYGKYSGMKNISFVGQGTAVIDLGYIYSADGIVAGHNKNVSIENITFRNMREGHFIELDANYNAKIKNCKFLNSKGNLVKEAINIDTPDKKTKGWLHAWSKFDKTPNKNVTISNCYFANLGHAIGTHKYSYGYAHTNIRIQNNTMVNIKQEAIRMMNWKSSYISNNKIQGTGRYAVRGILGKGVSYPTIRNNQISGFSAQLIQNYPIFIRDGKNSGTGSQYATVYSYLSEQNKQDILTNKVNGSMKKTVRLDLGRSKTRQYLKLN
ncbi:MAG: right-handed parallel beta-helix repeat-containing protein [Anaerostipes sp.]|nr:right-handed parallel beta-helix repeat-containing protein [Anaerostipes sp.]